MKIQICSDLHLEFSANRTWIKENPLIPSGEILIIAGDVYYLNRTYRKLDFIKRVANQFEQVYLIPGNHEYYEGYDAAHAMVPFEEKLMSNVCLLNNRNIKLKGVNLIFSTLWSKLEHQQVAVKKWLTDFHRIKYKDQLLSIEQYNAMHQKGLEFLSKALQEKGEKIIITHHLPSVQCNVKEFENSPINEAFCVDLTSFIEESGVDYWIYGHNHRNKTDFKIGNTLMLSNQLGYVELNEHHSFQVDKIFEI